MQEEQNANQDSFAAENTALQHQAVRLPATRASMTPSLLNTRQINLLWARTPKRFIKTRQGRGGQTLKYVEGHYVKQVLDKLFGHDWDFEIVSQERYGKHVVVCGKLTGRVYDSEGKVRTIIKTQYGGAEIKLLKGTSSPVNIGDDFKAAATDALKKCASELGVARDVYAEASYIEVEFYDQETEAEKRDSEKADKAAQDMKDKIEELD